MNHKTNKYSYPKQITVSNYSINLSIFIISSSSLFLLGSENFSTAHTLELIKYLDTLFKQELAPLAK